VPKAGAGEDAEGDREGRSIEDSWDEG